MRNYVCLLLAVVLGCSDPGPGRGVGRPPAEPIVRPEPSALRIAELYVADADLAEHFVELVVDDAESVALSAAELCGPISCVDTSGCDSDSVGAGARVQCDIGDLDLPGGAGELAVVSDDMVLAYLAWGADPAVFGSSWSAAAILSGATEAGLFVPLPFPMPFDVAVMTEADGSQGCAAPSPGAAGTLDASLCDELPPPLFISEVLAAGDDDAAPSWVELENTNNSAIRLLGVRLCQMPNCVALGYQDTIGALSRILVNLGRAGGDADSAQLYFPDAEPVRAGGEIVLLAPGGANVAAETTSLLSFLRYGAGLTGDISAAAVSVGLWPEIFDVARAPRVAGESLSRDLSGELRGSAWNPTKPPTPVAENPDISEATDLWQSCSFPRPWNDAEPSDIVVARVAKQDPVTIDVRNRGDQALDLSAYELALAAATFSIALPIGAGGGSAAGIDDEAVVRVTDTNVDADDFVRAPATPGSGTVFACDQFVISEVVTRPFRDWDDSTASSDIVPYDATPGPGTADDADEWIEIFNCSATEADLPGYRLELVDSSSNVVEVGVTEGPVYTGDFVDEGAVVIEGHGYLIVGNPDPVGGLDDTVEIRLVRTDGEVLDHVILATGELAPGGSTTVELRVDGSDCTDPAHLCWNGAPPLPANGEITLFDAGAIAQHFRWGNAARVHTDDAVTAGVWPLAECQLPELADDGVIELMSFETGHSPPDYR